MVDCGAPSAASRVIFDTFNNTKLGALITFHCEESNNSMTAVCSSDGEWFTNPASLVCGDGEYHSFTNFNQSPIIVSYIELHN